MTLSGELSVKNLVPQSGGLLRFPLTEIPATLDPAMVSSASEYAIDLQIFEGLLQLDQNNNVIAGIASSWSSPNAVDWTFNLRNDVYFHNGRQVKAGDFVYSWNRAKNAGGFYTYLFDDISSFSAPNDFTFIVTLTNPSATFPVRITMPIFAAIPSEASGTIGTNPVGTGAFKFVSWISGKVTLARSPNYYGSPAYLDTIEFKFYANTDAQWTDFQASNLDLTSIPVSQWNAVKTDPNIITGNVMITSAVGFDFSVYPDVRVRKAFQRAINRTTILSLSDVWPYEPLQIANGLVSPGKNTYDNSSIVIPYDPAGALSLLASAGWTDTNADNILDNGAGTNLSAVLLDSTFPGNHAIAMSIANDLSNIGGTGVGVDVSMTTSQYLATISRWGWMSDYPAPDNDLGVLQSGGILASRLNYSSATFDNYYSTALVTLSETTRNTNFYSADAQAVLNDAAILPIYYGSMTPVMKKPYVHDLLYTGQRESQFLLKYAWLAHTFSDVLPSYWAWSFIERLYNAGITGGCTTNPPNYCPDNTVTRAEMAVFLERGSHYPVPYAAPNVAPTFNDTVGHWAEDWIEALKNDGITSGCGNGNYCPEASVTRAQMAVFLLRARYGSNYTPPNATGVFADVPVGYWADDWIEQLAAESITGGCGAGIYCPDAPVTRAQMAVFLVRTFNLP
jgi:ABC-type transport system substrate-binding protein